MRHKVYGKKLGRNIDERGVLFKSLVHNLFSYGTIETTEAKAKSVKGLIDKIINLAKSERSSSSSKNSQRMIQSYFNNRSLEDRLVKDLLPKMQSRTSGYTSLIRVGRRSGDNTMVVRMSLIGSEELKPVEKKGKGRVQGTVEKTKETKKITSEKKGDTKRIEKSVKRIVKRKTTK